MRLGWSTAVSTRRLGGSAEQDVSGDIVNRRAGMLGVAIGGLLALTAPAVATALPPTSGTANGEVQLRGRLEVLHSDDFARGKAAHAYALRDAAGRTTDLKFSDGGPHQLGGQVVEVEGVRRGGVVHVAGDADITAEGTSTGTSSTAPADPGAVEFGVILVQFEDTELPADVTTDNIEGLVFGGTGTSTPTVASFYEDNSFGKLDIPLTQYEYGGSFVGPVFGPVTIPVSSTAPCDKDTWGTLARAEAEKVGYVDSEFTHVAHVMPKNSCVWQGSSQLPGKYTWDIVQGPIGPDATPTQNRAFRSLVEHELGHNLNAYHGASWTCTDNRGRPVTVGSRCTLYQYGDPFTAMGDPWGERTFNAFQKARVSWFAPQPGQDRTPWLDPAAATVTLTSSGTTKLTPIDKPPVLVDDGRPQPQILRVPVPGSRTDFYYVETRSGAGFNSGTEGRAPATGATIRIAPEYGTGAPTKLLDMTPASPEGFADAHLTTDKPFNDPAGVTITNNGVDSSGNTRFTVTIATKRK